MLLKVNITSSSLVTICLLFNPLFSLASGAEKTGLRFAADSDSSSIIVINEFNYNSSLAFNPEDWAEFINNTDSPLDISGWVFKDGEDGHHFVISSGTVMEAGEFIVVCRDTTLFHAHFPAVDNYRGNFSFGLSGGGDTLRIFDQYATLIDIVIYDDAAPWPPEPDGEGPTLELIDPSLPNLEHTNWRASSGFGTPGRSNGDSSAAEIAINYPKYFELLPPFPNPFNNAAVISYELLLDLEVKIGVYNLMGHETAVLIDSYQTAGKHAVGFKAGGFPSGIYFIQAKAYGYYRTQKIRNIYNTRKIVLLK